MIELKWMEKPKRFKFDRVLVADNSLIGIYCQNDTRSVHVFAIYKNNIKSFDIIMCHFNKEKKEDEFFDEDMIYAAICGGVDDEANYKSIRQAIRAIKLED